MPELDIERVGTERVRLVCALSRSLRAVKGMLQL